LLLRHAAKRSTACGVIAGGHGRSPAEVARLHKGGIVTAINGRPARPEELSDARLLLRSLPAGSTVDLSLIRHARRSGSKHQPSDLKRVLRRPTETAVDFVEKLRNRLSSVMIESK
jgi:C-terminal processing protease CtpA/Prc